MGQLVVKPTDSIKLGATYFRGYDTSGGTTLWGGTGTNLANASLGSPITHDTVSGQFQWDLSSKFSLRGWFGYTDSQATDNGNDQETLTYAGVLAFPDLGKEGNFGAIIVGAEPYVTQINGDDPSSDDVPLHIEATYKYQLNKNISITPGLIYLINPNQDSDNEDVIIGALRTTFKF